MKVSEWCDANLDSHGIYDSKSLKESFRAAVGAEPAAWPEVTAKRMKREVAARGLGGHVEGADGDLLVDGLSLVKALASRLVPLDKRETRDFYGRGAQFDQALRELGAAGF